MSRYRAVRVMDPTSPSGCSRALGWGVFTDPPRRGSYPVTTHCGLFAGLRARLKANRLNRGQR